MKRLCAFAFVVLLGHSASAQTIMTYQDGRPAFEKKMTDVEGSELLYEDWVEGKVILKEGKVFAGQKLKYNQYVDQFFFQDKSGISMAFAVPVNEVQLGDSALANRRVFRNGYPAVSKYTPASYYEVLADGSHQLLKKVHKYVVESKEFNSPVVKKTIHSEAQYFLHKGNTIIALKKDKGAFLEAVPEKTVALNAYFSSAKPNLKKEEEMVKLVRHLNTQ